MIRDRFQEIPVRDTILTKSISNSHELKLFIFFSESFYFPCQVPLYHSSSRHQPSDWRFGQIPRIEDGRSGRDDSTGRIFTTEVSFGNQQKIDEGPTPVKV